MSKFRSNPSQIQTHQIRPRPCREPMKLDLNIRLTTVAGDIGGTNSRLALYSVRDDLLHPSRIGECGEVLFLKKYLNSAFDSFEAILFSVGH